MEIGERGESIAGRWLTLVVVIAAALPYASTIPDYFIQDDFGVIKAVTARPWTMFPTWFVVPWTENTWGYTPDELRPFVALTYQLTGKWNPARPELHHLFNIAMHAGNALLVTAIARTAIGLSPIAAAFAGIVFAMLPAQAESVAWVTGRVDSMPALFYFATFLAYARWRRLHRWSAYAWALALFFVALFSKQNTITMVATLAAYDLLGLAPGERRSIASSLLAWLPFALMTAGFLALRRSVFGESLRAGPQSSHEIDAIVSRLGHHVQRTLFGHIQALSALEILAASAVVVAVIAILARSERAARWTFARGLLCFGVIWMAIGLAPTALAGYESPRHAYLASAGWAFALGMIGDRLRARAGRPSARGLAAAAAAAVVLAYAAGLVTAVRGWNARARLSASATARLQQEAASASPGTLMIVGVPTASWEYSSPFMLQPPFASNDLAARVHLVTKWRVYCCGIQLWEAYTRARLRAWAEASPRPPIVALRYAPYTGALSRISDAEFPELGHVALELLRTATSDELDNVIGHVLERMVAGHLAPRASRVPDER